jgi:uncharacterized protein (DUF1778 family)
MKSEDVSGAAGFCDEIPESGEIILLSPEDQQCVAEAILNPPEPAEALVKAFEGHSLLTEKIESEEKYEK